MAWLKCERGCSFDGALYCTLSLLPDDKISQNDPKVYNDALYSEFLINIAKNAGKFRKGAF
jgi:hypothetical protein